MGEIVYLDDDLIRVTRDDGRGAVVLAWGDAVEIVERVGKNTRVLVPDPGGEPFTGVVRGKPATRATSVLKFSIVDVQQGDGMILETPQGKKIFIDGGDNQLFARYVAARYRGTSAKDPLVVDAMIVTHGDADHFDGLNQLVASEKHDNARKRCFVFPKRVFHNGLVKGPSKLGVDTIFGRTVETRDGRAVIALEEDLLSVAQDRLNGPFKRWVRSLKRWSKHGPIEFRRLKFGDRAFGFLRDEGIEVDVYGPIETRATFQNKKRPALPLLRQPPKSVVLPEGIEAEDRGGFSASHTINGHSVTLRVRYGNVRLLLSGDLNQESMQLLREKTLAKYGKGALEAEIVKVPHHGSADFDLKALKAMSPVVSIVSSGDESSRKEHIHPRATLMAALGRVSRTDTSLVLCTELAAFFAKRGLSTLVNDKSKNPTPYFGFERTSFGIVQIRTDGQRVLVFTHSGNATMKEAYRFDVDDKHQVKFARDIKKR